MKILVWYIAALSAAAAWFIVKNNRPAPVVKVDELASKLQSAWADHHTVA